MINDIITTELIRSNILQFVKARDKAYQCIIAKGYQVPDYTRKCKAIHALYIQIEASKTWTLHAQLRWIHAMRHLLTTLLPFEFHDNERQRTYRKHMIDLLNHCDDLLLGKSQTTIQFDYAQNRNACTHTA